ncbi:MAG TPA: response regulator [Planctomycetota bacterium]|nr:response regulator [Planctomycetota bacterium]
MAKILIADDEKIVRDLLRTVLEHDGHTVDEVTDGEDAVAANAQGDYDIAIIDLILPRKNGLDTVVELRKQKPGLRFVVMTGALPALLDKSKHMDELLGPVVKLTKPMRPTDLLRAVREALSTTVA